MKPSRQVSVSATGVLGLLLALLVFGREGRGLKAALEAQAAPSGGSAVQVFHFDSDAPGKLPRGWFAAVTRPGGAPRWEVLRDDSAPSGPHVLAQLSIDATRGRYPLAVHEQIHCGDGELSAKFKPVSGKIDQAAGLVWRYRDENNYYLLRANALEDNVVLYKVEGGKRTPLAPKGSSPETYGVKRKVPLQQWSTLGVRFEGPLFSAYLNGDELFEVADSTFSAAGKVGVWTKADSVTYFDDIRIIPR